MLKKNGDNATWLGSLFDTEVHNVITLPSNWCIYDLEYDIVV